MLFCDALQGLFDRCYFVEIYRLVQDTTQGWFFKRNLTDLDSEFFFS